MAEHDSGWRGWRDRILYYFRQAINAPKASPVPGMGAVPHVNGTTFRVWAPHAERVFVAGNFNHWSRWRTPLAAEGSGLWSADVGGVALGDSYKYAVQYQGNSFLRTDPYARRVSAPYRDSIITEVGAQPRADNSIYQPPARQELVIYELHVGTFARDADEINGTFASLRAKLPYLRDLGINAIELMPVAEFDGDYSWGYNPGHPFAVTATYGGREALRALIAAAHDHGIAVLIDVVYNHFGPQDLGLWRFDGWHENGKGGIYFYNDWRSRTPWADTRPDYGRAAVRQYIRDNVLMWLEEFDVDGLRWDATSYIRNAHGHDGDAGAAIAEGWQLMQAINEEVRGAFPGRISIAEDMQENEALVRAVADGGAGFDAQWDAAFVHPVRQALIGAQDEERDMHALAEAIRFRYAGDAFARVIFTESHDEVANGKARVPEEIVPGAADNLFAKKRSTLGAALLMSAPGIPMLFQGQEFLESGWFDDQVPLDWQKARRHAGIVALYRALIRLRRNLDGVSRGLLGPHANVFHVDNDTKVLAYHRWDEGGPGDDVVVALNFANRHHAGISLGFPHAGIWRVRLNSDDRAYDAAFGGYPCPDVIAAPPPTGGGVDGMPFWGNVTLAPYAFLILSQE